MFITEPAIDAGDLTSIGSRAESTVRYDARRHSAFRTDDYVFSQLIPYLGNKRKLLPLIDEAVRLTGIQGGVSVTQDASGPTGTFADLFAGSGVVSRWAKREGFRVVANDWEPYSEMINGCHVGLNSVPEGIDRLLDELNDPNLAADGYITGHFCPADDDRPDPKRERCFYTRANGRRIDAMRERIAQWREEGRIDDASMSYLMAPFLYAVSYVSNTSGVFKAYHHGWGGQTGTALYRILSDIRLTPPVLLDNGRHNLVTRCDATQLADRWEDVAGGPMDIAYLDPPYNQHPYGSNYHVLNTVALWDKPEIGPMRRGTKSAIRTDWRTERRSAYNHARAALPELARLVDALPARWVLVSYSTDGNIPARDLLQMLADRGDTHLVTRRYKRYRVSSQRMSPRPHTAEFVAVLDKESRPRPKKAEEHFLVLSKIAIDEG